MLPYALDPRGKLAASGLPSYRDHKVNDLLLALSGKLPSPSAKSALAREVGWIARNALRPLDVDQLCEGLGVSEPRTFPRPRRKLKARKGALTVDRVCEALAPGARKPSPRKAGKLTVDSLVASLSRGEGR